MSKKKQNHVKKMNPQKTQENASTDPKQCYSILKVLKARQESLKSSLMAEFQKQDKKTQILASIAYLIEVRNIVSNHDPKLAFGRDYGGLNKVFHRTKITKNFG